MFLFVIHVSVLVSLNITCMVLFLVNSFACVSLLIVYQKIVENSNYSFVEMSDMRLMYEYSKCNCKNAQRLYAEHFPKRTKLGVRKCLLGSRPIIG